MTGSGKKKRITTRGNGQMLKGRIEHTKMYRHDNSEHNSDEERNEQRDSVEARGHQWVWKRRGF